MHVFIHGVPDTPHMWTPLIDALGLEDHEYETPGLPGFVGPPPVGFPCTKEAYADWLIRRVERIVEQIGKPVHLVGHDWGAILALRIASLRPDLFESWAVSNALIDTLYEPHRAAKIWATPVLGELFMLLGRSQTRISQTLVKAGLPEDIARHESSFWSPHMRSAILKLYRSARGLRFSGDWEEDLKNLPKRGLILWGETDPYVSLDVAKRFEQRWGFPVHIERGAGHWAVVERDASIAAQLKDHWTSKRPHKEVPDL